MLNYWRALAVNDGLPGLYFIFQKQYELGDKKCLNNFDAQFQFQPFEAFYSPDFDKSTIKYSTLFFKLFNKLPLRIQKKIVLPEKMSQLKFFDYDSVWKQIIKIRADENLTTFPGAFIDWDNTARYKNRATIFKGASPEKFKFYFKKLVETMPERSLPENYIFINAWNEWSEGTYLEPDTKNNYEYLNAVKAILVE